MALSHQGKSDIEYKPIEYNVDPSPPTHTWVRHDEYPAVGRFVKDKSGSVVYQPPWE